VPLFFLSVRTNVDYIVVGTLVTQYEDSASIAETLQVLRDWNPAWKAQSFMVDFVALEQVFTGGYNFKWLIYPNATL